MSTPDPTRKFERELRKRRHINDRIKNLPTDRISRVDPYTGETITSDGFGNFISTDWTEDES